MLKNWGVWLGQGNKNVEVSEELEHVDKRRDSDEEKQTVTCEKHAEEPPLLQKAESFSKSMISLANKASKKLTETMLETAESLRKSVEEGKLNQIIDKSMLGDFQKEQQRFVLEREAKKVGAAVPPWVGYDEEDIMQEQILALSADRRNFLRDPPAGVQFPFDLEQSYPVALVMLEEDELLKKMRFHLVPREVNEERFWRNYFYRVSLIKQSAQLTALTAQQASESHSDPVKRQCPPVAQKPRQHKDEAKVSISSPGSEFISSALKSSAINKEDLAKRTELLVLDKKEHLQEKQDDIPKWERELQEELEEYDVLAENEVQDEAWDREIEEMLHEDFEKI
ncbi:synapse-associated protein 1-like isoform X1 [Cyprinodon tularosa]|uniref:synapse-associated protein 1-like isoform X1 n=1 Tax=Cyprinodon tularosa TaxID=77115 RepID=UPI0018E2315D|nr:synapse-associated protein 1-like isoform X1 [Cyprinodon tularosa]